MATESCAKLKTLEYQDAKSSLLNTIDLENNVKENAWMWSEDKDLQNKVQSKISALATLNGYFGALKRMHGDSNDWEEDLSFASNSQKCIEECNKYKLELDQAKKEVEELYQIIADGFLLIDNSHLEETFEQYLEKHKRLHELRERLQHTLSVFPEIKENQTYDDVMCDEEDDIQKIKNETESYFAETCRMKNYLNYDDVVDVLHKNYLRKLEHERQEYQDTVLQPLNHIQFYSSLVGGKIISATDCKTVLELSDDCDQEENMRSEAVIVTLMFNPQQKILTGIKFDNCSVATTDLVAMALKMNEFMLPLQILNERIENAKLLIHEITSLREICAIDWLPDDKLLLLMVGKFVCHIEVADHINFNLTTVKGPQSVEPQKFNVSNGEMSLTSFVKNLEEHFLNI